MREFHIDKDIRLDAFNEKLLRVTFKIFQNLNKAAELLGYASSREMLECQSRKEPTQKKPTVISTSSKAATVTGNMFENTLNQLKGQGGRGDAHPGRGNPQQQIQGRGGGQGRGGVKKQLPDCYGCGRRGHTRDPRPAEGQATGCVHSNRPLFNRENQLWRRSTNGQIFVNQQIALGNPLYTRETFEKTWWPVMPIDGNVVIPHIVKPDSNKKQKGMHIPYMKPFFLGSICSNPNNGFIGGNIRIRDKLISVDVLIDTGALQGNYISKILAEKWQLRSYEMQEPVLIQIAAGKGSPIPVTKFCSTKITLLAIENVVRKKIMTLDFQILDGPYDIIIGRHAIIMHELWSYIIDAPQIACRQRMRILSSLLIDKNDVLQMSEDNDYIDELWEPYDVINRNAPSQGIDKINYGEDCPFELKLEL